MPWGEKPLFNTGVEGNASRPEIKAPETSEGPQRKGVTNQI